MKRFAWFCGLALTALAVLLFWGYRQYPVRVAEKIGQASPTLQMDKDKIYTHQNFRIQVSEGAVVLEGEGNRQVIAYTDFSSPQMTVCENYLAFFEYPAPYYYLCDISAENAQKITVPAAVSAVKLAKNGCSLAMADMISTVFVYNKNGVLQLTVETDLPLCDASISPNGKKVGVLLFSAKTKNGYVAEIYRTKSGRRLQSVSFTQTGLLQSEMQGSRMYLFRHGTSVGYLRNGKFHLFHKNP